jgi:hypothetical protein
VGTAGFRLGLWVDFGLWFGLFGFGWFSTGFQLMQMQRMRQQRWAMLLFSCLALLYSHASGSFRG